MKNIIIRILSVILLFCTINNVYAFEDIVSLDDVEVKKDKTTEVQPLKVEVSFDWLDIGLAEREEQIEKYKNLLFTNSAENNIFYTKDDFKKAYKTFFKDKNYKHHYFLANNGVTEDEEAKYCAFYYKRDVLVMYAIQYKSIPRKAFYYTAFGKMYYTDIMSNNYPSFPYYSMQYDRKGNLKSAIYFISRDLQYMYGKDKEFQGVWYKDKMYDKNGKQVLTRTNW